MEKYQRRPEQPGDVDAIDTVVAGAFETPTEARLIAALRAAGRLAISLVATDAGGVVGTSGSVP